MNILFMTNTYLPHVGGVARSIATFQEEFRKLGHHVLTVAPEFDPPIPDEVGVLRVPAVTHFNGTDFSVPVATPGMVASAVDRFQPDIVHSHHPFLLGGTAVRVAQSRGLPLVFTHHTRYDQFTHYVSGEPASESPTLSQFVTTLVTGYANLCDAVIAPSQSIAELIRGSGVETLIEVIPTGIDTDRFASGDGQKFRRALGIPADGFVVGFVGRLALEKNLGLLSQAVSAFLKQDPRVAFLVVGTGPEEAKIIAAHKAAEVSQRLYMAGTRDGQELIDAYHAMDVFAFASQSETQGMVLAEAMAAGLPVVALDAPGVREVVQDGRNGRLLVNADAAKFSEALSSMMNRSSAVRAQMRQAALETAARMSLSRTVHRELDLYQRVIAQVKETRSQNDSLWSRTKGRLLAEWSLLANVTQAAAAALDGMHTEKPVEH